MKHYLLGCLLLSTAVQAEALQVNVTNFNFNYQNPLGEGSAAAFSRSQLDAGEVKVQVEKIDKDFQLKVSGSENEEFVLKDAPSFMTEAETMNVSGFNMNLADAFSMSLSSGRFYSREDSLKLDGVSLNCNRNSSLPNEMDQLISGCINKMSFKSSKFSSESLESHLVGAISRSLSLALDTKADLGVKSLDLKTKNGDYDLSAEVKAQVSGKVKSNGHMNYDPASGTLTLKISEVKFSFLNITGKVFDELKKNESDQLKVKEPYVYYKLK